MLIVIYTLWHGNALCFNAEFWWFYCCKRGQAVEINSENSRVVSPFKPHLAPAQPFGWVFEGHKIYSCWDPRLYSANSLGNICEISHFKSLPWGFLWKFAALVRVKMFLWTPIRSYNKWSICIICENIHIHGDIVLHICVTKPGYHCFW